MDILAYIPSCCPRIHLHVLSSILVNMQKLFIALFLLFNHGIFILHAQKPGRLDNQKMDGYRGIWFELQQRYEYGDKYSGDWAHILPIIFQWLFIHRKWTGLFLSMVEQQDRMKNICYA